ncbi:sensor histidine kinase [Novosphingobium aquiterrae]|uniref:histidine kinase n=1 Tax=Novosphingobium aquiterrae TaxID=624388 RepID=A0ABV6PG33_9SPHN
MPGQPPFDRPRWYRAALRRLGTLPPSAILVLLTAVIVGFGLLLVQSSFVQRSARQTARSETDAMMAVKAVEQSLLDAETGQRGYLLTGDPGYLRPYDAARARIGDEVRTLEVQLGTSGNPEDEDRLRAFGGLVDGKLEELDQTVRYARAGSTDAAIELVRTGTGKATMDTLRRNLAALSAGPRIRREAAFAAVDRAEARQVPLLLAMWATLVLLVWAAVRSERRRAEAEAVASQAERLHRLNEQVTLLAQELNHRVKNLFGVVLSLVGMAGRDKGESKEVIASLSNRIHALARAHSLAFGTTPDALTELERLLGGVLDPYQNAAEDRIRLRGGPCAIAAQQVTPLALIVHELATNAAKYGALSSPDGHLVIDWSCAPTDSGTTRTTLIWREMGGPPSPAGGPADAAADGGFGTRMTDAVLRQIEGTIERDWPESGVIVTLSFIRSGLERGDD